MSSEPEQEIPAGAAPSPTDGGEGGTGASASPPSPGRSRRRSRVLLLAVAGILVAVAVYNAILGMSLGSQEVHLYGQDRWSPGLPASLRVVVLRHSDQRPISGASVRVLLSRPKAEIVELASGSTDAAGTLEPSFTVPDGEGPARLLVLADSPAGHDFIDRPIRLAPAYRIFMASDRRAYRTGQRVRIQAGVSTAGTGEPVSGRTLSLRAFAPGGIPFAMRAVRTDERGGAAGEFEIAPDAPAGTYRVKAALGASAVEISLPVSAGADPPFPVWLGDLARFAAPGGLVRGYVAAADRLGSRLRDATTRVWLEDDAGHTVSWTSGRLDPQGRLSFGLPTPQADELTILRLHAEVTDAGLRSAEAVQAVAVTPHAIQLLAVPEARFLVPGTENRVYLAARYPDGGPARATIRYAVGGRTVKAECSSLGIAVLTLKPGAEDLGIALTASDAHGRVGAYQATLPVARPAQAEWALRERYRLHTGRGERAAQPHPLLLRPDRGFYRPGEPIRIEVVAPGGPQRVYVDGYAGGQTLFSRSVELRAGRGAVRVRVPEAVSGMVWLRAYTVGPWGDAAYAERAVFVRPPSAPRLSLHLDRPAYEPGQAASVAIPGREPGTAAIAVSRAEGGPAGERQGLAIPGLLLVPVRPEVPGVVPGSEDAAWRAATEEERQSAALATLALAPRIEGWTLHEDAYARKEALVQARRAASWAWLRWMVLLLLAVLWLVATRLFSQPQEGAAGERNGDGVASATRFVIMAVLVALVAALLFRLVGPDRAPDRRDQTRALLAALQEQRQRQARSAAKHSPSLPPAVLDSVPDPDVAFWGTATRAGSRGQAARAFGAPSTPGEWLLSGVLLSGPDAPARAAVPLRVESDLAVEFEPPAAARPGDIVSVLVRVRNTLPVAQAARLKLMAGRGLALLGEPILDEEIPGGAGITRRVAVSVHDRLGPTALTLVASGERRSVVARRGMEILPALPEAMITRAGRVSKQVTHSFDASGDVTQASVTLEATPSAVAAARLGDLQRALPATTLERAAAVEIARIALQPGGANPRVALAALERAFQELLASRDAAGWFATRPGERPHVLSTAYAVAVLDAARDVVPGGEAVARSARRWLQEQRRVGGTWPEPWGRSETEAALVAWALGGDSPAAQDLRERYRLRAPRRDDPYLLSLLALGIGGRAGMEAAAGPSDDGPSLPILDLVAGLGHPADVGDRWLSSGRTVQGLSGEASASEATAMAVLALIPHAKYREQAQRGAEYLAAARQPGGGWGGLFSTAMALRALSATMPKEGASGALGVAINGRAVARLDAQRPKADLLGHLAQGQNTLSLTPTGNTGALYEARVAGPGITREDRPGAPNFATDISPRGVRAGQPVTFTASVSGEVPSPVRVEVPLPAAFRPVRGDLDELVQRGQVIGYQIGARGVRVDVDPGRRRQKRWIEFRLVAPGRCDVLAPAPIAYPVVDPGARAFGRAVRLKVE